MKKKISDKAFNLIFTLTALVLMWVIWVIAYFAEGNEYVIPSFGDAMKEAWELLGGAVFWHAFANTLLRTLEAFALSFVLAAALSALSEACRPFGAIFRPFVAVLRTIPTMAIILILLLWTTPLAAPVIVAFLVTFPLVYAQFSAAFAGVDRKLLEMAKLYGVPRSRRLFKIYVPAVLPNILSQAGAAFSLTLKIMVSAEVMARTYRSIGGLMQDARNYLEIPELFALTVLTVVAGGLLEWALGKLTLLTRKWTCGSQPQMARAAGGSAVGRRVCRYCGRERGLARVKRIKYSRGRRP